MEVVNKKLLDLSKVMLNQAGEIIDLTKTVKQLQSELEVLQKEITAIKSFTHEHKIIK